MYIPDWGAPAPQLGNQLRFYTRLVCSLYDYRSVTVFPSCHYYSSAYSLRLWNMMTRAMNTSRQTRAPLAATPEAEEPTSSIPSDSDSSTPRPSITQERRDSDAAPPPAGPVGDTSAD